jgi:hypothetical protein
MEAGRRRAGVGLRVFGSRITAHLLLCSSFPNSYQFLERTPNILLCVLYHVLLVLAFTDLQNLFTIASQKKYCALKYLPPTIPDNHRLAILLESMP